MPYQCCLSLSGNGAIVINEIDQIDKQYVMSLKPNSAIFVSDKWDPRAAREDLKRSLDQSRGCCGAYHERHLHYPW